MDSAILDQLMQQEWFREALHRALRHGSLPDLMLVFSTLMQHMSEEELQEINFQEELEKAQQFEDA